MIFFSEQKIFEGIFVNNESEFNGFLNLETKKAYYNPEFES